MPFPNKLFRLTSLWKLLQAPHTNINIYFTEKGEAAGLEDWFIDRKPDELKFIGITSIAKWKGNINRAASKARRGQKFCGTSKRKTSHLDPINFAFPKSEIPRSIQTSSKFSPGTVSSAYSRTNKMNGGKFIMGLAFIWLVNWLF